MFAGFVAARNGCAWGVVAESRQSGYKNTLPACRQAERQVSYTVTALAPSGVPTLAPYDGAAFVAMIEGWRSAIEAKLPQLLATQGC